MGVQPVRRRVEISVVDEVYAAQDVLPTGVRRRRSTGSFVLPVVLLGELLFGVVIGATWELASSTSRPASATVSAVPESVPVRPLPVPLPLPAALPSPSLSPSPSRRPADASEEPLSVPAAEPVAVRNPFAAVG